MDALRTDDLSSPLGPFLLMSLVIHLLLVFLLPIVTIDVPERPAVSVIEPAVEPGGADLASRGLLAPLGSLRMQVLELAFPLPSPAPPSPVPLPGPEPEAEVVPSPTEVAPVPSAPLAFGSGTEEASPAAGGSGMGGEGEGGDAGEGGGPGIGPGIVTQPVIVAMVWPEFPKAAKKQLKVPIVLAVHVTAEGAVDQVEVEAESGCPPCEAAAIASAWQLKFEPATRDGVPIPMWTRFPVVFGRR